MKRELGTSRPWRASALAGGPAASSSTSSMPTALGSRWTRHVVPNDAIMERIDVVTGGQAAIHLGQPLNVCHLGDSKALAVQNLVRNVVADDAGDLVHEGPGVDVVPFIDEVPPALYVQDVLGSRGNAQYEADALGLPHSEQGLHNAHLVGEPHPAIHVVPVAQPDLACVVRVVVPHAEGVVARYRPRPRTAWGKQALGVGHAQLRRLLLLRRWQSRVGGIRAGFRGDGLVSLDGPEGEIRKQIAQIRDVRVLGRAVAAGHRSRAVAVSHNSRVAGIEAKVSRCLVRLEYIKVVVCPGERVASVRVDMKRLLREPVPQHVVCTAQGIVLQTRCQALALIRAPMTCRSFSPALRLLALA